MCAPALDEVLEGVHPIKQQAEKASMSEST